MSTPAKVTDSASGLSLLARFALHEPGYALSHQRALGIGKGVQHIPPGAGEGAHVARLHLAFERGAGFGRRETGVHRHRWCFLGEQNPVAILFWQVLPRPVNVVAHADQDVAQVLALPGGWPGSNRPLTDAQGGVGHHVRLGHLVHMTQAVAGRARPLRRVRRKILGVEHRLVGGIGAGARIHHPHQAGQGGHTAHGGTRIAGPPLLLQRHRWWQAVDRIYVRHARLVDQAPCIGGHRLKVASLRLGIDGAEGQRGLPGAGDTREHHQRIPRDRDVHLFEVVLTRATHLHEAAGRSGTRGFTERIAWHVVLLCSNGRCSYRAPGRQLVRKVSLPPPCRCGRVLSCGRSTRSSASPQVPEPPSPAPRCRERAECP